MYYSPTEEVSILGTLRLGGIDALYHIETVNTQDLTLPLVYKSLEDTRPRAFQNFSCFFASSGLVRMSVIMLSVEMYTISTRLSSTNSRMK